MAVLMFLRLVKWLEASRLASTAEEPGVGGIRRSVRGRRGVVSFPRRGAVKQDSGRSLNMG